MGAFLVLSSSHLLAGPEDEDRKAIITEPTGQTIKIEYKSPEGRTYPFQIARQIEYERRANFRGFPIESEDFRTDRLLTIKNPAQLVSEMLRRRFLTYLGFHRDQFLGLSPLESRDIVGPHGDTYVPIDGSKLKRGDFTVEIPALLAGVTTDGRNPLREIYTVGRQRERSTYYDTSQGELKNQKVFIRIKEWYPLEGEATGKAAARSLFIKVGLNEQNGLTQREEFQVKLPLDFPLAEMPRLAGHILKRIKPNLVLTDTLGPKTTIDNIRYSFDLVHIDETKNSKKKVGFVTIDSFTGETKGKTMGTPINQMEIEILPEQLDFFHHNTISFRKLFERIESEFGATLNFDPKCAQVMTKVANP